MPPAHKAQILELAKENVRRFALVVGDGVKDVSLILASGIAGKGALKQCSQDYSISQFRYLQKLILEHSG